MTDLHHRRFPRASTYDAGWLLALDMGPNPLWLLEDLLADLPVERGAKVLDLGSGRGATSVFLTREWPGCRPTATVRMLERDSSGLLTFALVSATRSEVTSG